MGRLFQDVKFGTRFLLKHPAFAVLVILTLGLGIGASTAIFSVVNRVLIQPLPYPDAEQLVLIRHFVEQSGFVGGPLPPADVIDFREQVNVFSGIAASDRTFDVNLTGDGPPEVVRVAGVTSNFFDVVGIGAEYGRTFAPLDGELPFMDRAAAGTPAGPKAVISHGLWQRRFGEEPDVVGRMIQLNDVDVEVIGVLPRDFRLHMPADAGMSTDIDVWQADQFDYRTQPRNSQNANRRVIARMLPGVSPAEAQRQADAVSAWQRETYDYHRDAGIRATVTPMHDAIVGHVRPILLSVLVAVGIVLLIASANVANLLLVQSSERGKEIAIRAAVGGGRRRIARQLLTESLLVATIGGLVGLLVARWGIDVLLAGRPANLPRLESVPIDGPVLLFTLLVTLVSAILFGMAPALQSSRPDLHGQLNDRGVRTADGRRTRLRGALVVGEVALAMMLLTGAGLMMRSLRNVDRVDLGFRADSVLSFHVTLPVARYATVEDRGEFFDRLERKAKALPGVAAIGATSVLPLGGQFWTSPYRVDEMPGSEESAWEANYQFITPGAFDALGIELIAGRLFSSAENQERRDVVVVDRHLAARAWPGLSPIGRKLFASGFNGPARWFEVVGVVETVHIDDPLEILRETIFFPHSTQGGFFSMSVVARSDSMGPEKLAGSLRGVVSDLDPEIPLSAVRPLSAYVADATAPVRFATGLIALFALVALVLAAIGVYGVVSSSVRHSTREIGLRLALGAPHSHVAGAALVRGLHLGIMGLAAGLLGSIAMARLTANLLVGVSPTDPLTLAAVAALLLVIAVVASVAPARRAIQVEPMDALRYE
ncbi:MAG: ABC transporter permease [Gemmatimonadota bacterium]|nr:ABC transporter permease [Gemmatimonadota bacterium]